MESTIIEIAATLGVGAVFGIVVFFMYRRDRISSEDRLREDRKFMEDRLTKLLEEDQESRQKNTEAITELTTLVKSINGRNEHSS